MPSRRTTDTLRRAGALLMLVVAGVHFQQYVDFMSLVPTVGVLFLLNAAGGAALLLALLGGDRLIGTAAMLGSIALAGGSLASIGVALQGSFFGYREPTLRLPIVIAIASEVLLIGVLVPALVRNLRRG
jgi:hypothetical protein